MVTWVGSAGARGPSRRDRRPDHALPRAGVAGRYQLCGHSRVWRCDLTVAAWLARGLDPPTQVRTELTAARRARGLADDDTDPYSSITYQAEVWLDPDPADDTDEDGSTGDGPQGRPHS
jgi:hypothetical protein